MEIQDKNGNWVVVDEKDIMANLASGKIRLFGFSLDVFIALREEYLRRDGPLDPTPEDIKRVFL